MESAHLLARHLQDRQALYRQIASHLPGGAVFVVDRSLRYLLAEGEALGAAGFTPDQLEGRSLAEALGPALAATCEPLYRGALAGTPFELEHFSHGRHYFTRGVPLEDDAGQVFAVLATSYDISDQKLAERVAQVQSELLESVAVGKPLAECIDELCLQAGALSEGLRACVLLSDARREHFVDVFGTRMGPDFGSALVGAPINAELVATRGEAVFAGRPVSCTDMENDTVWSPEWRRLCLASGVLACHSIPVLQDESNPRGARAAASFMMCFSEARAPTAWEMHIAEFATRILRVLLARENDRNRLAQRGQQFRMMADTAPAMLGRLDEEGAFAFLSRGWYEFTGQPEGGALGRGWMDAVHADDRDAARRVIARAIGSLSPFQVRFRLRHIEGGHRWVLLAGRARIDADGEYLGHITAGMDIDEAKHAEDALRDADRRKDEFMAVLAHELRNPLAPIGFAAEMLQRENLSAPDLVRTGGIIHNQVQHMARLLEDLMDASRISAGRLRVEREPVTAAVIAERSLRIADPYLRAKGHRVTTSIAPDILLWADPLRIAQALSNLLANAAKYTDPGGRISLTAKRVDDRCEFVVQDDGIGLDPGSRERIFQMFSQESSALDRSEGGLGIGLALVRAIVLLHDGTVTAYSEGLGKGSRFVVCLPLSTGPAAANPVGREPDRRTTRALKILVADDNASAAELLSELLALDGHCVEFAVDGAQALAMADTLHPEVVILDIGMPVLNGYEVASAIRATAWGSEAFLVAATGWGQESDKARALAAGFDLHLTKPLDAQALLHLLVQLPGAFAPGSGPHP